MSLNEVLQKEIRQRELAEMALRDSEVRFQATFEQAAIGIAHVASDGRFLRINPRFCDISGWPRHALENLRFRDLVHPDEQAEDEALLCQVLTGERSNFTVERRFRTKSGSWAWVNLTASLALRVDGSADYFIVFIEDAEDQHRQREDLERMVAERTRELERNNRRLHEEVARREEAQRSLEVRVKRLSSLREIDLAITGSVDMRLTLRIILHEIMSSLEIDAAQFLVLNKPLKTLESVADLGMRTTSVGAVRLRMSEGLPGHAVETRQTVMALDLAKRADLCARNEAFEREGFTSYIGAPLVAKGQIEGVLEVFHRSRLQPSSDWFDFLEALSVQSAIAIQNAVLFNELQHSRSDLESVYDHTLAGWARALELRDQETEGHSKRVTELTLRLAEAMNTPADQLAHIRRGALLHDIGKIAVPDSILFKRGDLTPDEWEIMRRHPLHAQRLLAPIRYLAPAMDIPVYHHERWDGKGYPFGLNSDQIPLPARVFAVVDVWDALTHDRPYRQAWPRERVADYLRQNSGSHFDPEVVRVFLDMFEREEALHAFAT